MRIAPVRSGCSRQRGEHDLSDLLVAEHVLLRFGELVEGERSVEDGSESSVTEGREARLHASLGREERFLRRAGAERHSDEAGSFERDTVEVELTQSPAVSSHTHDSALERERLDLSVSMGPPT
jgi:hypothetical protein